MSNSIKKQILITGGFLTGWAAIYIFLVTLSSLWNDFGPLEAVVIGSQYLISIGIAVTFASLTIYLFNKS